MKSITVYKISLEDYNTLREAGYDIKFHLPSPIKKSYTLGTRSYTEYYIEPAKVVRAKVQVSTKTPYVTKYPKSQWPKMPDGTE